MAKVSAVKVIAGDLIQVEDSIRRVKWSATVEGETHVELFPTNPSSKKVSYGVVLSRTVLATLPETVVRVGNWPFTRQELKAEVAEIIAQTKPKTVRRSRKTVAA